MFCRKWAVSSQQEYIILYNNAVDRFRLGVSSTGANFSSIDANTFGAVSTNTWYFVYCCHDSVANVLKISVNNGTVDTIPYTLGVKDSTAGFRIGGGENGLPYADCTVDEIGMWKRDLTAAELTYLYNSGVGRTYNTTTKIFE